MLRWFKKRYQRPVPGKNAPSCKKDEYGFDGENSSAFIRKVEHIYEEIPDIPSPREAECVSKLSVKNRDRVRVRARVGPELPPRNSNRLAKHRASYAQWRFQALSRKTLSLPELVEATTNSADRSVLSQCCDDFFSDAQIHHTEHGSVSHVPHVTKRCRLLPENNDGALENLVAEFDRSLITGFQDTKYSPQESDSGYDYSGSSSNGSDVNDSGLCGSYEFHLSKAEQLRRIEQEIHNLSNQSHCDISSTVRSRDRLLKKRQKLFAQKSRDHSLGSLSSSASVTSDLDLDDETLAYGERADFSSCEDFSCRKPLSSHRKQTLQRQVDQERDSVKFRHRSHDKALCKQIMTVEKGRVATENVKERKTPSETTTRRSSRDIMKSKSSVTGETTPRYQRPSGSNRLLSDLIMKNNDNLFFA
ncbi:uncharacterized protein LOC135461439 [Liolophura sinensis]|uniref:uncharacterized protein LOC135461439 n=1 Tax=Liolophura sinensis TaxID=3198878 RepID=UPI00315909D4